MFVARNLISSASARALRQGAMALIGAELAELAPGVCDCGCAAGGDSQQHGYVHAGVIGTLADTAGGYAGFTLFPRTACADGGIGQPAGARHR
jgi:acyl-coenzyme A thioesterase PaaI-like protein